MKEDKAQRKQAKHKRVFFGLGDEGAVDDNPHGANAVRRKEGSVRPVVKSSCKEIANRFVNDAGYHPRRSPSAVVEIAAISDAEVVIMRNARGIFV